MPANSSSSSGESLSFSRFRLLVDSDFSESEGLLDSDTLPIKSLSSSLSFIRSSTSLSIASTSDGENDNKGFKVDIRRSALLAESDLDLVTTFSLSTTSKSKIAFSTALVSAVSPGVPRGVPWSRTCCLYFSKPSTGNKRSSTFSQRSKQQNNQPGFTTFIPRDFTARYDFSVPKRPAITWVVTSPIEFVSLGVTIALLTLAPRARATRHGWLSSCIVDVGITPVKTTLAPRSTSRRSSVIIIFVSGVDVPGVQYFKMLGLFFTSSWACDWTLSTVL